MATKIITAYITIGGVPQTALAPTIKIVEIGISSDTVIIPSGAMVEVTDIPGVYKYAFSTYDFKLTYAFSVDAGAAIPDYDRYQISINESYVEDISYEVWEEPDVDHDNIGTMGERVHDITSALLLIEELLKYSKNRTKIDPNTFILTVYDNDGVTPIRQFDLKDEFGVASITRIFDRLPK